MFNSLTYGILNIIVYANTHISNHYTSIYPNRYGFQGQEHDEEVLDYVYEYTKWDSVTDTTYKDYLSFDGVSDFVDCGSVDRNITDNLSIEAWIRTTANSTFSNPDVIVSDYQFTGYHLLLRDGKVALEGRNGNDNIYKRAISTQTVNDGEWHHVVGVADLNDTWHIYVDGVLANAVDYDIPNPNFTNTNHLYISRIWDGRFKFEGDIRDVSLWNRVRSAGEVYYDYKTGHPAGNESGLVAYFPLNEGSGTTATDLSTTGINGTIYGATWQSDTIIDTNLIGLDSIRVPNRNSVNYTFRMTDTRLGRFLNIDPLYADYPWNSPYAFSENRVIDGRDLEGGEFVHYTVDIVDANDGKGAIVKNVTWEWSNKAQNNKPGKLGAGVEYTFRKFKSDNSTSPYKIFTYFKPRKARKIGVLPVDYGLYYGPTTLNQLHNLSGKTDYSTPAIDAVDEGARQHDKAYDAIFAKGESSLMEDWGATPADEKAVESWQKVVDIGVGGEDPFNKQKITKAEYKAAKRGVLLFKIIVNNKKTAASQFMINNFGNPNHFKQGVGVRMAPRPDKATVQSNYNAFLDKYMQKGEDGVYSRKDGMWNESVDDNGNTSYSPKTKEQLKE